MSNKITSSSNEKYKWIKKVVSKGPSTGYFVIEGLRAIQQALDNGKKPEIVVGTFDDDVIDIMVTPELFKKISGVKNPQGILAVFEIEKKVFVDRAKYLVLDGISDPGNLGSILRTALAFDYTDVILTKGSVSIYNPKVIRSSLSAIISMNIYEGVKTDELKQMLDGKYVVAAALENSVNFRSIEYPKDVSIIIGNEANGITDEVLSMVDDAVMIPMSGAMESLNAAIASAILLEYFYNV